MTERLSHDPSTGQVRPVVFHQSAGAVVFVGGRCLVIRRADNSEWTLPKGHLDRGEGAAEAAMREVREETGLTVKISALLGQTRYQFGRGGRNRKRVDWFLAVRESGEIVLEGGFAEWALLNRTEAEETLTHPADREIVRRAFDHAEAEGLAPVTRSRLGS